MQKRILSMILAATVLATAASAVQARPPKEKGPKDVLSIAVFGDSPYGTSNADTAQFDATPAFIQTINDDPDVSLVLHVGDIHSGKQICTLAYDQSIYNMWTAFQSPLVYTPGDNEWTDCHKSGESGGPTAASRTRSRTSVTSAAPSSASRATPSRATSRCGPRP